MITSRFGPASVELAVEDLLPRAEVQPRVGDRHDHLVVDEQILQMRVAVVLAAPMVAVVTRIGQQVASDVAVGLLPARRSDLVEPLEDVGLKPGLVVVDPHRCRDVHRSDEDHPLAHSRVADGRLHVLGDADELTAALGVEREVRGMRLHALRSYGLALDLELAVNGANEAGEPGFEPGFTVLETARVDH